MYAFLLSFVFFSFLSFSFQRGLLSHPLTLLLCVHLSTHLSSQRRVHPKYNTSHVTSFIDQEVQIVICFCMYQVASFLSICLLLNSFKYASGRCNDSRDKFRTQCPKCSFCSLINAFIHPAYKLNSIDKRLQIVFCSLDWVKIKFPQR